MTFFAKGLSRPCPTLPTLVSNGIKPLVLKNLMCSNKILKQFFAILKKQNAIECLPSYNLFLSRLHFCVRFDWSRLAFSRVGKLADTSSDLTMTSGSLHCDQIYRKQL